MSDWMSPLRNKNRGYRSLSIWQDAIEYYRLICSIFRTFPYELKRVASNQIAAADSIHRNIAEGYCRRSHREYVQYLYIAIASVGETVSALHAYKYAEQINEEHFNKADALAYKIENGLMRLIEKIQQMHNQDDWNESFIVRESNAVYEVSSSANEQT